MRIDLQRLIVPTLPLTVFTYVVNFGLWMGFYALYKYPFPMPGQVGRAAENILSSQSQIAYILSFAIVALSSMLIAQMNNKFSFIRTRTFLPTFLYLFISTCWLQIHGNYIANLASFFVLLAIFLSLDMYKKPLEVEKAFLSFFLLALSVFLVPDMAYLIVFFWIGYFMLKCFSGKVFFASVFGFATPWMLFLSIVYFIWGEKKIVTEILGFFNNYSIFYYENIPAIVYGGIMFLILALTFVQMIAKSRQDSIQTRNELGFIKLIGFGVVSLFAFRFSNYVSYMPLIAIFFSILTAYTFTLIKSRFNSIVFISIFIVSLFFAFYLILV